MTWADLELKHVGYRIDRDNGKLPYVRVSVRGVGNTYGLIANGAVPWHASERMREIAQELTALADRFDHDYPK